MTRPRNTRAPFHPRLNDLDLDVLGEGENDLMTQEKILSWEHEQDTGEYQSRMFPDLEPAPVEPHEQIGNLFDFEEEI